MSSPINECLASRKKIPEPPFVGMGVTTLFISDRHACTVIQVTHKGKRVLVQQDHETRTDKNGFSEIQTWVHAPNPNGRIKAFTLRKDGRWILEGDPMRSRQCLLLGKRMTYWDPHF